MNTASDTIDLTHFDVRVIPCRQKHSMIFQRWADLPVGDFFVLINDHDPVPLYYQFAVQFPGAFTWSYLMTGPDEFRVKITRVAPSPEKPAIPPPDRSIAVPASDNPLLLDARGLEPPEPLMRILAAAETLPSGGTLRAQTDRQPVHLFPELTARNIAHLCQQAPDGSWITTLTRG
jgi:uncharacterized protein (DUF2249 family)